MIDIMPSTRFICMDPATEELFSISFGHGMPEQSCYVYDHYDGNSGINSPAPALGRFFFYEIEKTSSSVFKNYLPMPDHIRAKMQMTFLLLGLQERTD